ncbi:MAG: RDD family protein [Mucilaginibacter sp.]|uniref:RDD family protein n=1 Tax=Mucilaginibacter sp. TaxID=1882438 RepID=UPI003267455E
MDNEYYILDNGEKLGPFTARELMDRPLEPSDVVLQPTETQGTFAFNLPEFTAYFKSEGIYFPTQQNTASYLLRLPAFIIDYLMIVFGTMLLAMIFFPQYVIGLQPDITPGTSVAYQDLIKKTTDNMLKHQTEFIIIQLGLFVIMVLYNALCESGRLRASVGKYAMGLVVVDELGYSLTFWHALKRNLGKTLYQAGQFIVGPLIFIAYLRMIWGDRHQAFHDLFSGCYVVKKNA